MAKKKASKKVSQSIDAANLRGLYNDAKSAVAKSASSDNARARLKELSLQSLEFLDASCDQVDLVSRVPRKKYISYERSDNVGMLSRPANASLFESSANTLDDLWSKWEADTISESEFAQWSYTAALAPCLAMEMFDRGNKKGPATYFECFIGHLFASELGVEPSKKVALALPKSLETVRLTMDYIFEMPNPTPNIHLAVKMSTRERIVQAWAHQGMLDSAYGDGAYIGAMVLFAETKLDLRKREVVEICVPGQWLAYQELLATMDYIYYFDPPVRYTDMSSKHSKVITVEQFRAFFDDRDELVPPS